MVGLELQGVAFHIGGKSALSLRGVGHYLALSKEKLFLYGTTRSALPAWFARQFSCEVRRGRLFSEESDLEKRLYVRRLEENETYSPFVSEPERALLEMLDDVPGKQSLDEAGKRLEPLYTLRSDAVQVLLVACLKVKVKRLFFSLAEELRLPALEQLDLSSVDFGAPSVYVHSRKGGSFVLKHPRVKSNG